MTPRSGRASMREGPLSNLFKNTESSPPPPAPSSCLLQPTTPRPRT